jgi:hypothetical protein
MFETGSFVATEYGWVRNTELPQKILDLNLHPQSFETHEFIMNGYQLILSNGQMIQVSIDHQFRVYNKLQAYYLPVKEVKIGTQLGTKRINKYANDTQIFYNGNIFVTIDIDFAYMLGLVSRKLQSTKQQEKPNLIFSQERLDIEFIEKYFIEWLQKYGEKDDEMKRKVACFKEDEINYLIIDEGEQIPAGWYSTNNSRHIEIVSRKFIELCYQLLKYDDRIIVPDELFSSPKEVGLAFLNTFSTSSKNINEIFDIANLIAFLGLHSKFDWQDYPDGTRLYSIGILVGHGEELPAYLNKYNSSNNRKRAEVRGWQIDKNDLQSYKKYSSKIQSYVTGKIKSLGKSAIDSIPLNIEHKDYFPVSVIHIESTKCEFVEFETETGNYLCMGLNTKD